MSHSPPIKIRNSCLTLKIKIWTKLIIHFARAWVCMYWLKHDTLVVVVDLLFILWTSFVLLCTLNYSCGGLVVWKMNLKLCISVFVCHFLSSSFTDARNERYYYYTILCWKVLYLTGTYLPTYENDIVSLVHIHLESKNGSLNERQKGIKKLLL